MRASAIGLWYGGAAVLAVIAGLGEPAAAGEEATIKAFSAWLGQGLTFQTGPKEATFVGSFVGPMFVETDQGIVKTGRMTCPAIVEIGLEDGKQQGQGRCTITAQDGARIFAEINCAGVYMVGCNGDFKLTGGTDRFTGISGSGKVTIRSDQREISSAKNAPVREDATGSLTLTELHYTIP